MSICVFVYACECASVYVCASVCVCVWGGEGALCAQPVFKCEIGFCVFVWGARVLCEYVQIICSMHLMFKSACV